MPRQYAENRDQPATADPGARLIRVVRVDGVVVVSILALMVFKPGL